MRGPSGAGSSDLPDARRAVVRAPCVSVRAAPDHRSEMTSQWLCGETLEIVGSESGWIRTRGPDGYEGWCSGGGVLPCDPPAARRWEETATARSLDARIEPGRPGRTPGMWLPFGARLLRESDGGLRLPLEVRVPAPADGSIVGEDERRRRFPSRGSAVVRTAELWWGTPYLWGGRTRHGADCSGFVQAVYALHAVALPRDSGMQMEETPLVEGAVRDPAARRPGDLLFFRAPDADAVTHVALSLGGSRIAHVADGRGGYDVDDLADPPPVLAGLDERLVAVTRPPELDAAASPAG